jgi:predicted Zn-dependent protease
MMIWISSATRGLKHVALTLTAIAQIQGAETATKETISSEKTIEMAGLQLKLGQTDTARDALQTVLKREPNNFNALQTLAQLEFTAENYAEADALATAALVLSPDDAKCRIIKASTLSRLGKTADASQVRSTLSASDLERCSPELVEESTKEDISQTEDHQPNSADQSPELDLKLNAFYAFMEKKDLQKAKDILKSLAPRWSESPDYIAASAQHSLETGNAIHAVTLLEKLRRSHPADKGAYPYRMELANAYESTQQLDKAQAIYSEVAADTNALPEQRQNASQSLFQIRQTRMLTEGDSALAAGDVSRAAALSTELVGMTPEDETIRTFQASVLKAQGRHTEAARIFSSLKAQVQPGKRFDTQLDYAGSLASARRYDEAIHAYQEIVNRPGTYTAEERKEAEKELKDLQANNLPAALVEGTYGTMNEGSVWRATGQFSSARLGNGMRLHARTGMDQISLSKGPFPEALETDRWFTVAGVEVPFSSSWAGTFYGGAYNDGGMSHALIDYNGSKGFNTSLRLAYNDPARDTYLLEALNGRQHSAAVNVMIPLAKKWALDATLGGRQIEIDGNNIGKAFDSETQLRWHPFGLETDIFVGYSLEISDFSPDEKEFKSMESRYFSKTNALFLPSSYDAVPDSIHRHALQLHGSKNLTDKLVAGATVEAAYRQENSQVEFGATAELLWHATSLLDLNARAEYYTSGAGPNLGGDVFLGTLGLKVGW